MFNYQYIAVRIEHTLQLHGYAKAGDADIIRSNPMAFMDTVLKQYEKASEEHDRKSAEEEIEVFIEDYCSLQVAKERVFR